MDTLKITQDYYAAWMGVDPECMNEKGLVVAYSPQRDWPMEGYARAFHVLAYKTEAGLIVSHGKKAAPFAESLKRRIGPDMDLESLRSALEEICGKAPDAGIKYLYSKRIPYQGGAFKLRDKDVERYREFFAAVHPNVSDISWVDEYFAEIVDKGFCYGVEDEEGRLLSVVDLPPMPFMKGEVQELGINTVRSHRGRGHAKKACLASIEAMLERGVCPQWSTGESNAASDGLAKSIGFEPLALTFAISFS
ncbi:MAG: GNAT family N-acetyltransferase [Christensenellales bacterium]|jgi:hypothetical protein